MLLNVYKIDGSNTAEEIEICDDVFAVKPNDHAIYLEVKAFLANQRQGTHKAKERGEVAGGGKKPWKQKGRGGARAGSSRSPLWVGGGTIFGPRPRDYRQFVNKKIKNLARKSALSYKVTAEQLIVIEDFNFETPKTKNVSNIIKSFKLAGKRVLFLTEDYKTNVYLSGRNIEKCKVLSAKDASTYDIVNNQKIIIQKSAVKQLEAICLK